MFERRHHQLIARLLHALDAGLLRDCHCLFGGGTAIALRFGEYRESVDVDFLVSSEAGYRQLRQQVRELDNAAALMRQASPLFRQVGEIVVDQYGIRTRVEVDDASIKLEIVREARIALDQPAAGDQICGISTLGAVDMAATKLLANSDRGADDGTFNRDLIDLAMMAPDRATLEQALSKAERAYGDDIRKDLARSVHGLRNRNDRLDRCMHALDMRVAKASLWQRIRQLERTVEQIARP